MVSGRKRSRCELRRARDGTGMGRILTFRLEGPGRAWGNSGLGKKRDELDMGPMHAHRTAWRGAAEEEGRGGSKNIGGPLRAKAVREESESGEIRRQTGVDLY